eukprot:gene28727-34679_t
MPLDLNIDKVDLFFSAKDLPKLHTFNNTDPFAVLYLLDRRTNSLVKHGTTELIKDNRSPHWATSVQVDYMFELIQELHVKVFHFKDGHSVENEGAHELIGEVKFELSRLMRAPNTLLTLPISNHHDATIDVRAELRVNNRDVFAVTFSCNNLTNKDGLFGTSDPFITMSRMNEDGSHTVVWKSEVIDNSLNPRWKEVAISVVQLCNNDLHRPIILEVFDQDSSGKHESMGSVQTSLDELLGKNGQPIPLVEKKGKGKGVVIAGNAHIVHRPTFTEFIKGGLEVSLSVAIDFTASNGDPDQRGTLHYLDPSGHEQNQYEQCMSCIGSVLQQYDTDKRFQVYGFGARPRGEDNDFLPVNHCLPLSPAGGAVGIDGVLGAYRTRLPDIMLSGPTLFGPILNSEINRVKGAAVGGLKYQVVLILTDGTINDMDKTKEALIEASGLPMSVIIMGVGAANFGDMRELDGDDAPAKGPGKKGRGLLKHGGKTAERDIVQFVGLQENLSQGLVVVAQQLLAELPNQVLDYFEKRGIMPHHARK